MEELLFFNYYDTRKVYYKLAQFNSSNSKEDLVYILTTIQEVFNDPDEVWNNRTSELSDAVYYFICIKIFNNATFCVYAEIKDDLSLHLYKIEVHKNDDYLIEDGVKIDAVDAVRKGLLIKSKFRI